MRRPPLSFLTACVLLVAGCGSAPTPATFPMSVAYNPFLHLQGTVTDVDGNALSDVTVQIARQRTVIVPGMLQAVREKSNTETVAFKNGSYDVMRTDHEL